MTFGARCVGAITFGASRGAPLDDGGTAGSPQLGLWTPGVGGGGRRASDDRRMNCGCVTDVARAEPLSLRGLDGA